MSLRPMEKVRLSIARRLVGKRLFGMGREDDDYYMLTQRFGIDLPKRSRLNTYKGLVAACIDLISETAAGSYDPHIYRQNGDQREDIQQHPILELLNHPGGFTSMNAKARPFTRFDLINATIAFLKLQGEVYWYVGKGAMTGRPREIVILRADRVGTSINEEGDIDGYFIRRSNGDPIPLAVDEIVPFSLFNPKDPYHGMGTVEQADEFIETDELTNKFTSNFFRNNAGLNGVLTIQGEVATGAFQKFVHAWRAKYEGVDNAGKTAILRESEAKFTKVGLGLDELDMNSLRKMSRDDIAMMFRVPLPLLGKGEETGMGRANIEALEYIFSKYNQTPLLKRFDGVIQFMLARYYGDDTLIVEHKSVIPEDKEYELNRRKNGVDIYYTRNEIRDEDGLDPVDGGDELRAPINSFPISEDSPANTSTTEAKSHGRRIFRFVVKKKKPLTRKS